MNKKSIIASILIFVGLGAIILTIAVSRPPYIETPWKDLAWWSAPNSVSVPRFEIIYEPSFGGEAMRLYNINEFYHKDPSGGPLLTDINKYPYLVFNITSRFNIWIWVYLETTGGDRQLSYFYAEGEYGRNLYDTASYGLGNFDTDFLEKGWVVFARNIKEDFERAFQGERILSVKSIKLKGDITISNCRFYSELPPDIVITRPKILRFKQEHRYDSSKKKVFSKTESFNEYGVLVRYINTYLHYGVNGKVASTDFYIYDNEGKSLGREIGRYPGPYDTEMEVYDGGMNLRYQIFNKYRGQISNHIYKYYKEDGSTGFTVEQESWTDAYVWKNSRYKVKTPDGNIFKEIYVEHQYDKGHRESRWEVRDLSNQIISEEIRWHNPGLYGLTGLCFERRFYENGKTMKITRGRNIYLEPPEVYARLECDYDVNNHLTDVRMVYNLYKDWVTLEKKLILSYDKFEETVYRPWNLNYIRSPAYIPEGVLDEGILKKEAKAPDNLVIDGDMRFKGIERSWKPVGRLIHKKTKGSVRGKTQKVLLVERPHEEGEVEVTPWYLQQFIPIKEKGEYKLSVEYLRKTGTAHIGLDWLPIEDLIDPDPVKLVTIEELVKYYSINLVDFEDSVNEGLQVKDFVFTTPNEPGLLVLRIGAASIIEYSNIELKPYVAPTSAIPSIPSPTSEISGPVLDYVQSVSDSLGEEYSFKVQDKEIDSTGDTQYVVQEVYKDTPVLGGYIVLKVDRDKNVEIVEDKTVKIKEPRHRLKTPRTTRGDEVHRILKEKIGVPEEDTNKYDLETVIASIKEDGSSEETSYGWHVRGPGVDRIVDTETGKDLYRIEGASVAPPTRIKPHKIESKPGFLYTIRGIYLRFKEWLTNLFQQIKRRV